MATPNAVPQTASVAGSTARPSAMPNIQARASPSSGRRRLTEIPPARHAPGGELNVVWLADDHVDELARHDDDLSHALAVESILDGGQRVFLQFVAIFADI